jgi:hypothetical protein
MFQVMKSLGVQIIDPEIKRFPQRPASPTAFHATRPKEHS